MTAPWHTGRIPASLAGEAGKRLALLVSYGALLGALVSFALTPPAPGYELSIYNALPGYIWALLIVPLFLAIGLLIHTVFFVALEQGRYPLYVLHSLCIVVTVNIVVITLPIIRGYYMGNIGDEFTHIGYINDILRIGHTGPTNFYPATHVLTGQICMVAGLDPVDAIKYITPMFYLLYLSGMFLLARSLTRHRGKTLFITSLAAAVLLFTYFNFSFLPTHIFVYVLPLILYLFFRRREVLFRYNALLLAFLLVTPFTHPLGTMLLMALFVLFAGTVLITRLVQRPRAGRDIRYPLEFFLHPTGIVLIIFSYWFFSFALSSDTLQKAYEWFFLGQGITPVEIMSVQLQQAEFSAVDFIQVVWTTYGQITIYSFLIAGALLLVLYRLATRQHVSIFVIYFSVFYVLLSVFYVATLFTDFIVTGRSIRIYCWPLVAGIFVIGIVWHDAIMGLGEKKKAVAAVLVLLLCIAAYIGIFSVFPSPITKQINIQGTKMNVYGMSWFFAEKTDENTFFLDAMPYKSIELLFGRDAPRDKRIGHFEIAPLHFGYDTLSFIGETVVDPMYLVISERIRANKMYLWVDRGQIRKSDLLRLEDDPTSNRIYYNGDVEIHAIGPAS